MMSATDPTPAAKLDAILGAEGWSGYIPRDEAILTVFESLRARIAEAAEANATRAAAELAHAEACWTDLGNAVLENAPESFDGDEDQDGIAVRYVRWLEGRAEAAEAKLAAAQDEVMRLVAEREEHERVCFGEMEEN